MQKKYIMGSNDGLVRSKSEGPRETQITASLQRRLYLASIRYSVCFYSDFFGRAYEGSDIEGLARDYELALQDAKSLGLFAPGGIREKDHLSFYCLACVLSPEIYVESGVFIGSSLHAFSKSPSIEKIIAIDPDFSKLKVPLPSIPPADLVSDKDFSELDFELGNSTSLVYFDDHIDTAGRIIQAYDKGFRYLLFDDSNGMEGICQRNFPAIPTIPMIMNPEIFLLGDKLSWSFHRKVGGWIQVSFEITSAMIDKCLRARALIRKAQKIPDLGEYIPQSVPERMLDTSKFLVELVESDHH